VTSGPSEIVAALTQTLPDIPIQVIPSVEATAFENLYSNGVRRQYLRGRAATISLESVPARWRAAPLILLAPLVGEVEPELAAELSGAKSACWPQPRRAGYVAPIPVEGFHRRPLIWPAGYYRIWAP
jgi:hypothetical protein